MEKEFKKTDVSDEGLHSDEGLQSETSVFLIFFLHSLRCKI